MGGAGSDSLNFLDIEEIVRRYSAVCFVKNLLGGVPADPEISLAPTGDGLRRHTDARRKFTSLDVVLR